MQTINKTINNYGTLTNDTLFSFLRINLPSDIKKKIFEEHFSKTQIYPIKYSILMSHVESKECKNLNCGKLISMIETFIEDEEFCQYVCNQNELFSQIYNDHYGFSPKKAFKLMNNLESLTASWLMYLYH